MKGVWVVVQHRPWIGVWLLWLCEVLVAALVFITDPVGYLTYVAVGIWSMVGVYILWKYNWHLTKLTSLCHLIVMPFLIAVLILRLTLDDFLGHPKLTLDGTTYNKVLYVYTWIAIGTWTLCLLFDAGDVYSWYASKRKVCVTSEGFYFVSFSSNDDGDGQQCEMVLEPASPGDFFMPFNSVGVRKDQQQGVSPRAATNDAI